MNDNHFLAFREIVESRRSIRLFEPTPIPEGVIQGALDLALLAPNSSNLQPWEFYWIQDPQKKQKIVEACFSQAAAATAAELVVCVARTATWKKHCSFMKDQLTRAEQEGVRIPKAAWLYYEKTAPFMYTQGFLSIFGICKWIFLSVLGCFKPVPREPMSQKDMTLWATKTTALACEHFMLALRAQGFDSCPMEGMDSLRVRKILKLPRDASVPMIIACGKRRAEGITLPRIRAPRDWVVKIV